jgi:Spy/CpxP family protein refolding chaperone
MSISKSRIVFCGLVMAVLLTSAALANTEPNAPCPKGQRPGPRLREKLGLSDEQAAQMEQLMTAHMEKMKEARQAMQEKRKALDDAVNSGAGEEAIRATAAELGTVMGDNAVLRAAHIAEVKKVLTAEQYEKWQQFRQARREHRKNMAAGPGAWGRGEGKGPHGRRGSRGWRGRMGPPDPQKIFELKDTNGDGNLTLEEFTATGRPTAELFEKADTNGDGSVTPEEFTESIKQFMNRGQGPQ